MKLAVAIILMMLSGVTSGEEWHCRNSDMEITCRANKCRASDGFTPMDVTVSGSGRVSVCAYSGCWEGKGRVLGNGSHLVFSAHKLKWTGTGESGADFIIGVDRENGIAVLNGHGYAMPLSCERGASKNSR